MIDGLWTDKHFWKKVVIAWILKLSDFLGHLLYVSLVSDKLNRTRLDIHLNRVVDIYHQATSLLSNLKAVIPEKAEILLKMHTTPKSLIYSLKTSTYTRLLYTESSPARRTKPLRDHKERSK